MKVLPTIALGLLVLIAAVSLLGSSLCAARNDIFASGGRIAAGFSALVSLGVMLGGIALIARINKKKEPATSVTPKESVTPTESQSGKSS
jgi:ABC-type Na+ efflux pump permease subunit